MSAAIDQPHRPAGTPLWIFRWRPHKEPLLPKLVAVVLMGGLFTFLITTVQVRVEALEKSAPRKASLIYLGDGVQGRALSLKAEEGGPFPSRFELSQWGGMEKLEAAAMDAVRIQPAPYEPELVDLSLGNELKPLDFATKGERFFPTRHLALDTAPDPGKIRLSPVLYPLSGIRGDELQQELPPFDAAVDATMSATAWRFLIRLNSEGGVAECVSLENSGEASAPVLEKWLRRIQFKPEPGKPFRWIALGIGFINQPVDGTDAR